MRSPPGVQHLAVKGPNKSPPADFLLYIAMTVNEGSREHLVLEILDRDPVCQKMPDDAVVRMRQPVRPTFGRPTKKRYLHVPLDG